MDPSPIPIPMEDPIANALDCEVCDRFRNKERTIWVQGMPPADHCPICHVKKLSARHKCYGRRDQGQPRSALGKSKLQNKPAPSPTRVPRPTSNLSPLSPSNPNGNPPPLGTERQEEHLGPADALHSFQTEHGVDVDIDQLMDDFLHRLANTNTEVGNSPTIESVRPNTEAPTLRSLPDHCMRPATDDALAATELYRITLANNIPQSHCDIFLQWIHKYAPNTAIELQVPRTFRTLESRVVENCAFPTIVAEKFEYLEDGQMKSFHAADLEKLVANWICNIGAFQDGWKSRYEEPKEAGRIEHVCNSHLWKAMEWANKLKDDEEAVVLYFFQDGYSLHKHGTHTSQIACYVGLWNLSAEGIKSHQGKQLLGHCTSDQLHIFTQKALVDPILNAKGGLLVPSGPWKGRKIRIMLLAALGDDPGQRALAGFRGGGSALNSRFQKLDTFAAHRPIHPVSIASLDGVINNTLIDAERTKQAIAAIPRPNMSDTTKLWLLSQRSIVRPPTWENGEPKPNSHSPLWYLPNFANHFAPSFPACELHLLPLGVFRQILVLMASPQMLKLEFQQIALQWPTFLNDALKKFTPGLTIVRCIYDVNKWKDKKGSCPTRGTLKGADISLFIETAPFVLGASAAGRFQAFSMILSICSAIQQLTKAAAADNDTLAALDDLIFSLQICLQQISLRPSATAVMRQRAKTTFNSLQKTSSKEYEMYFHGPDRLKLDKTLDEQLLRACLEAEPVSKLGPNSTTLLAISYQFRMSGPLVLTSTQTLESQHSRLNRMTKNSNNHLGPEELVKKSAMAHLATSVEFLSPLVGNSERPQSKVAVNEKTIAAIRADIALEIGEVLFEETWISFMPQPPNFMDYDHTQDSCLFWRRTRSTDVVTTRIKQNKGAQYLFWIGAEFGAVAPFFIVRAVSSANKPNQLIILARLATEVHDPSSHCRQFTLGSLNWILLKDRQEIRDRTRVVRTNGHQPPRMVMVGDLKLAQLLVPIKEHMLNPEALQNEQANLDTEMRQIAQWVVEREPYRKALPKPEFFALRSDFNLLLMECQDLTRAAIRSMSKERKQRRAELMKKANQGGLGLPLKKKTMGALN